MSTMPATKTIDSLNPVLTHESVPDGHTLGRRAVSSAIQSRIKKARSSGWEQNWLDRIEAFVSGLSVRDNFWHKICSLIWLPYAFFSGISMKKIDEKTFSAVLPFTRFNRNWYRAMAGAALLGNCEVAGGMYVFGICGSDYTVVCKHLDYKFLRPCLGPAEYKMTPREDIHALIETGREFNLTIDMDILQQVRDGQKDRRVGKAAVTFHITPQAHRRARQTREAQKTA